MLGRSIGNYGVVSKIGEGGMGVVYLARHVTLGRRAAIKVLRPALSSNQDIVSRFFNEARAVTAVRHPGIVEVYDFGFLEDRTAYIIMEYLEGESLAARLRRKRPAIATTLTILRAIARALQAAHESGIVHRDLKPDNVFLVPDSELPSGERVKILDFGIAKLTAGAMDASQTTTGTVMGTPTYMSPEQCRGAGAVDHRADLYSLGCVAYEMLCGQPPFTANGPGDVIARHLYFEPTSLRSHCSEISPELDELVLKLLKKEPRARFSTAADLVRAIDQLAAGAPPLVAPPTPVPTEFVPTLPMMRDTTLNGAASSSEISSPIVRRSRFTILAGAVTFLVVFLVIILLRTRDPGDASNSTAAAATASLPAESTSAEGPPAASQLPPPPPPPAPAAAPSAADVGVDAGATPIDVTETRGGPGPPTGANGASPPAPPVQATQGDNAKPSQPAASPAVSAQPDGAAASGPAVPARKEVATLGDPPEAAARSGPSPKPFAAGKSKRPAAATKPSVPDSRRAIEPDASNTPHVGASPTTPGAPRPVTPSVPPGTTAPNVPSAPSADACTRDSFAAVLDAKAPSQAAVRAALARLKICKPVMESWLYDDIRRRLIQLY
jgi:serine/threonine-protein kinase